MRRKILKAIITLVFILIACIISSVIVNVMNIVLFHGTIDKRVMSFIHCTLGVIIGIIASRDKLKK